VTIYNKAAATAAIIKPTKAPLLIPVAAPVYTGGVIAVVLVFPAGGAAAPVVAGVVAAADGALYVAGADAAPDAADETVVVAGEVTYTTEVEELAPVVAPYAAEETADEEEDDPSILCGVDPSSGYTVPSKEH